MIGTKKEWAVLTEAANQRQKVERLAKGGIKYILPKSMTVWFKDHMGLMELITIAVIPMQRNRNHGVMSRALLHLNFVILYQQSR